MKHFVAEVIPKNLCNLRRPASLDTLKIGRAVVCHAASNRLPFGPDDVDAVAAVERTLHSDDSRGQQRPAASHRGDGTGIDVRGSLAGQPRKNPSLAAFHARSIRREPRADGLACDRPYK